ncbi:hypothetical protein TCAL_07370 [Tigriopus californicus]|uniref:N-alpha-acetyltransferase 40 n=1 Tax=Tigriopus californicus TaxID=6832 RepID=A0A553PNF1_TIGCA|nr:N-alpha-acetyltransferase 40-like [Tigriopus californicus]TRY79190.1 hypothetical protein TCAL_07370 [Tigriopus californicus]|eukprot:TCALIF_07370-PA protein Name:"Similar to NAA40 N-alpha-acetyltransferase 40 (Homo sapiens)" AED:0.04 eAED:0.04 QI:5/1/0.75/1/0.66/0.75/4/151/248
MTRKDRKSKAAQKKKDRLEMERRMNERVAIVKLANTQTDPLDQLPSFQTFRKNDVSLNLSTQRVTDLSDARKVWVMDLIRTNMKALYEQSSWGWKEATKQEEMYDDAAWYLIAETEDGVPVAYAQFRYDMDYDDEVLYVYEIQLEEAYRRKGLGKFMMMILELLSFKADMRKIMLTAFKHNKEANQFFKGALKYEIDETCPLDDVHEQFDYEILSKFNKKKLAREAKELSEQENHAHNSQGGGCCGGH